MAARHIFIPLVFSAPIGFKLSFSPGTFASHASCYVLRRFTSGSFLKTSSKRKMQTSTAYTLVSQPSLPPIVRMPDKTKTRAAAQINDRMPEKTNQFNINCEIPRKPKFDDIPLEKELPKSISRMDASPSTEARPRPKLRARKAAMKLTPAAVKQLRKLLDQPSPKLIKIGVRNRGCSGLAYHLEFVDKPGSFDEEVEQDGVKVIIDSKALFSIIGTEMDWVEERLNQRFVFKNPNISRNPH